MATQCSTVLPTQLPTKQTIKGREKAYTPNSMADSRDYTNRDILASKNLQVVGKNQKEYAPLNEAKRYRIGTGHSFQT